MLEYNYGTNIGYILFLLGFFVCFFLFVCFFVFFFMLIEGAIMFDYAHTKN